MAKSVGLNRGSGKRNLTVQLDEEIIQAAKVLAARKGTSVSGLVTQKLKEMIEADLRYQQAMQYALDAMHNAKSLGVGRWSREEINEERLRRFDR